MKTTTYASLVAIICALLFSSCSPLTTVDQNPSFNSSVQVSLERVPGLERQLFDRMNSYRRANGKAPLNFSDYLDDGSYISALKVGQIHQQTHKNEDGKKHQGFKKFTKKSFKVGWKYMAENVGWSYGRDDSSTETFFFEALINSPEHNKNILGDEYNFSSVAVVKTGQYYYLIQRFGKYPKVETVL